MGSKKRTREWGTRGSKGGGGSTSWGSAMAAAKVIRDKGKKLSAGLYSHGWTRMAATASTSEVRPLQAGRAYSNHRHAEKQLRNVYRPTPYKAAIDAGQRRRATVLMSAFTSPQTVLPPTAKPEPAHHDLAQRVEVRRHRGSDYQAIQARSQCR